MKGLGILGKRVPLTARIDRRRTRMNPLEQLLDDSDEGSYCSSTTTSDGSASEYRESDDSSRSSDSRSSSSSAPHSKARTRANARDDDDDDDDEEEEEKCAVSRRRRKRSASASVLRDDVTSESSDSDVGTEPVRKTSGKKRLKLSDSEGEPGREKDGEVEDKRKAAAKRKERKNKLLELLEKRKRTPVRRRRTLGSEDEGVAEDEPEDKGEVKDSEDESSEVESLRLIDSSEEEKEADNDSLKDFIVEDEKQKEGEEEEAEGETGDKSFRSHLPRQFITESQLTHFQVVVKALLINALDTSFLKSLYDGERTKRYAEEMKLSLHHFDERMVLPRLENLKQRSRWKERYKERVECYPKLRVSMVNVRSKDCEACELHRHGRYCVRLSGQLYHTTTLQEDQFMPDDSQMFFVGSVCASRTQVYHALKHFKFHLLERCRTALQDQKEAEEQEQEVDEDVPVKDTVNKAFTKLMDEGWITQQYDEFQEHLNAADFFQEEKLD